MKKYVLLLSFITIFIQKSFSQSVKLTVDSVKSALEPLRQYLDKEFNTISLEFAKDDLISNLKARNWVLTFLNKRPDPFSYQRHKRLKSDELSELFASNTKLFQEQKILHFSEYESVVARYQNAHLPRKLQIITAFLLEIINTYYIHQPNSNFSLTPQFTKYINEIKAVSFKLIAQKDFMPVLDTYEKLIDRDFFAFESAAKETCLAIEKFCLMNFVVKTKNYKIDQESASYERYIQNNIEGEVLIRVYSNLAKLYTPRFLSNKHGSLRPFYEKVKRYQYLTSTHLQMREFSYSAFNTLDSLRRQNLERETDSNYFHTKYESQDIKSKIILINSCKSIFSSKIRVNDPLVPELLTSMGNIFFDVKDYAGAYRCYFISLQLLLKSPNKSTGAISYALYFPMRGIASKELTESETWKKNIPNYKLYLSQFFYSLYSKDSLIVSMLDDSVLVRDKYLSTISVKTALNFYWFLNFTNQYENGKNFLLNYKLLNNENTEQINLLYEELFLNKWLQPPFISSYPEVNYVDSIYFKIFSSKNDVIEGDQFLTERFLNDNSSESAAQDLYYQVESNKLARWYNEMKESADKKIAHLDSEIISKIKDLRKANEDLNLITSKNKLLRTENDSINTGNVELKNSNSSLISENESLEKRNKWLSEAAKVFGILILIGFIVVITLFMRGRRLKRENKENNLAAKLAKTEANLKNQQILNDSAGGHDVLELIARIPEQIKSIPVFSSKELQSRELVESYSNDCFLYLQNNYNEKDNLFNTIIQEIDLLIKYIALWERAIKKLKYVLLKIQPIPNSISTTMLPKSMLTNLVSNSFKHGGVLKKQVTIEMYFKELLNGDIEIIIKDDGKGFTHLNSRSGNRGLNLLIKQVNNYNIFPNLPYFIKFSRDNIANQYTDGEVTGVLTTIILKNRANGNS